MTGQWPGDLLEQTGLAVTEKRGKKWAFPDLNAGRTALIGFEVSRLGLSIAPKLRASIPRIDWLARTLRAGGGPVFWSSFATNAFDGPAGTILGKSEVAVLRKRLADPAWTQVSEGIQHAERDRIVTRPGYVGLGSELRKILQAEEIETILLAGAETDGTIDSTARAAINAGFKVIVVSDCCAASDDTAHTGTLVALHRRIADVRPADDIITELRRNIAR